MAFIKVDFPLPDKPTIAILSPRLRSTEEIEQLQEGGYDDTSVNSEKAAPVTEVPETPSMEEPKEVQP